MPRLPARRAVRSVEGDCPGRLARIRLHRNVQAGTADEMAATPQRTFQCIPGGIPPAPPLPYPAGCLRWASPTVTAPAETCALTHIRNTAMHGGPIGKRIGGKKLSGRSGGPRHTARGQSGKRPLRSLKRRCDLYLISTPSPCSSLRKDRERPRAIR
ncbi:hypothetical protein SKAU_G00337040 [Synaphobranchus kaupii]|uniref:Uncharacterized protein n=1 Tax=Synaphobranchus kaupii TaxID=118154 RepID=A0A9Q1IGW3_SYNKA|nr:hypothetical protein SKAU_G00337040 [Synaphobranchus kaupii]